ncbi:hypothetical protein CSOJ01_13672 [Colletotrichum sojae]|uniref:Uncharacterized protein n=1 Tax=Colletotrichum sojae TaxID=2175907 RepID=A0A8H6ISS7_9PEZI|nr:hypothetical protein CSOJ01_13672 [Colletotrichum sojae]
MVFDQDEFVHLLTDYYQFCNRVFWHCTVRQAPLGGWPSITPESLAGLAKNDIVIDLLRHVPYVDYPEQDILACKPIIMDHTTIIDYRSEETHKRVQNKIEDYTEPYNNGHPPIPPSCACIATRLSRNGYFVAVDTDDGYIYCGDPNGQHDEPPTDLNLFLKQYNNDAANEWRACGVNVYRPADFFAFCKQRFLELRWIGLGQWHMEALRMNDEWDDDGNEKHWELANKMKEAGWPGDGEGGGWDRAKFEATVNEDETEE